MAMTSEDVQNQSFSIARKGYDVDEVDVFLERVADEFDEMNQQISQLEEQVQNAASFDGGQDTSEDPFGGFDTPATIEPVEDDDLGETVSFEPVALDEEADSTERDQADEDELSSDAEQTSETSGLSEDEKDARIAELEKKLAEKRADDSAISQALITAQRSADEIIANAKGEAADILANARAERERILDKAEIERQKVQDAIDQLEESREDIRGDYQDMLTDFITDASRRLAEIGASNPLASAHARLTPRESTQNVSSDAGRSDAGRSFVTPVAEKVPVQQEPALEAPIAYSVAQETGATPVAVEPVASTVEKDFSGFGDSDDFEFDEID